MSAGSKLGTSSFRSREPENACNQPSSISHNNRSGVGHTEEGTVYPLCFILSVYLVRGCSLCCGATALDRLLPWIGEKQGMCFLCNLRKVSRACQPHTHSAGLLRTTPICCTVDLAISVAAPRRGLILSFSDLYNVTHRS